MTFDNSNTYLEEWNRSSLSAWQEWKKICSICGCSNDAKKILAIEVTNAFRKKFYQVISSQLDSLFTNHSDMEMSQEDDFDIDSSPRNYPHDKEHLADFGDLIDEEETSGGEKIFEEQNDDENDAPQNPQNPGNNIPLLQMDPSVIGGTIAPGDFRLRFANEFDIGLIEKRESESAPKNYKDLVWQAIKENVDNDPPLKIIRGMLIGRLGIINEIAERFLRCNYPSLWEKCTIKESRTAETASGENESEDDASRISTPSRRCRLVSLDTPTDGDDDRRTVGDSIPSTKEDRLNPDDEALLRKNIQGLFTDDNAAIYLTYLVNLSLETPELLDFIQRKSTCVYERMNLKILPALRALSPECHLCMQVPGAVQFQISLMKEQLRPEKNAAKFLSVVEEKEKSNQRGGTYDN